LTSGEEKVVELGTSMIEIPAVLAARGY